MAIRFVAELKNRVAALLRDTRKLHTCAGLGFIAEDALPKDQLVGGLVDDAWSVLDLRGHDGDAARSRLADHLDALPAGATRPMVLLVDKKPPRCALAFAQALADRRAGEGNGTVDLGDRQDRVLPPDMSAVVVVDGVNDHGQLPQPLQRVDFWEMV